jgi:MFS transporter, MHS family, proline/betaine transporter
LSDRKLTAAARTPQAVAAGAIGNVLEWYDFAIYGYFAAAIGRTYFPDQDPVAQVLSAFGVFAVGFLMRPVGGALIGRIADRFGRRAALTFSVMAMAIPTFLVGALPGYQTLGVMAPILLVLLRMAQGLSIGGEYTTSIVFMVEHAPPGRRGVVGALAGCGTSSGILLGAATATAINTMMSPEALAAWGWRIPFLLGLVVGLVGFVLRRNVPEAPKKAIAAHPSLIETVRDHGALVAWLAGLSVFKAVGFYLMFLYIVSWLQFADGIAPSHALAINTVSMVALILVTFCMGWLSDRIGRKPLLLAATAIAFIGGLPLFWLMHHSDPILILIGQMGFVLAVGMSLGVQPATMVEVTPLAGRCTVVALGYNVTYGIIGGFTPLVATWLVQRTENDLSPALMIVGAAAISFLVLLRYKETYKAKLDIA